MTEAELLKFLAFIAGISLILIIIVLAIYIYLSIATMYLAKKTGTKNGWLAWIPIANFYLYSKMAGMHWWPVFLLAGMFIPKIGLLFVIAFIIFNYIWFWKIFEKAEKPGWWILFSLIPIAGWVITLIFIGIAAWSNKNEIEQINYTAPKPEKIKAPSQQKLISPRIERIKKLKGSLK